MSRYELHIISTGLQNVKEFCEIASLIQKDVDYFHIREKALNTRQLIEMIELLKEMRVPLSKVIINDRVDLAYMKKAAGIQLPYHGAPVSLVRKSFPDLKIGSSIHSLEDLKVAEGGGADFVLYGHIFETNSKPGKKPRGINQLKEITSYSSVPVIAIGGIKPSNISEVLGAGANGIAVMSGILLAEDPIISIKEYRQQLKRGVD